MLSSSRRLVYALFVWGPAFVAPVHGDGVVHWLIASIIAAAHKRKPDGGSICSWWSFLVPHGEALNDTGVCTLVTVLQLVIFLIATGLALMVHRSQTAPTCGWSSATCYLCYGVPTCCCPMDSQEYETRSCPVVGEPVHIGSCMTMTTTTTTTITATDDCTLTQEQHNYGYTDESNTNHQSHIDTR